MNNYKPFLIFFLVLILQSCVGNKYLKYVKSGNIDTTLKYFDTNGSITIVEKSNKYLYSDSLSNILKKKIDTLLYLNKENYNISDKIKISNDILKKEVDKEINKLYYDITTPLFGSNEIKLPQKIDSILDSQNQRFAILIRGTGFVYNKENTFGKKIKGNLLNIATLGFSGSPPIKNQLSLSCIVIDAEKNEISTYLGLSPIYKNPIKKETIQKNLDNLFFGNIVKK